MEGQRPRIQACDLLTGPEKIVKACFKGTENGGELARSGEEGEGQRRGWKGLSPQSTQSVLAKVPREKEAPQREAGRAASAGHKPPLSLGAPGLLGSPITGRTGMAPDSVNNATCT